MSNVERDHSAPATASATVRTDGVGAARVCTAPAAAPDRRTAGAAGATARSWLGGAVLAVRLLTIVPLPTVNSHEDESSRSAAWFPLVGALTGGLAGGVRVAGQNLLGPLPATALALAALIVVTGALHQDGLADTVDGIGARGDAQRRLAAMRDHAIGAFGVLALLWWGLVMLSTLASLSDTRAFLALMIAGAVSRWAAVAHAAFSQPARTDGLGAAFHAGAAPLAIASILAVAITEFAGGPLVGLAALGAAVLGTALSTAYARGSLGGRTGDTLGATIAIAEVAVCLALLAAWRG